MRKLLLLLFISLIGNYAFSQVAMRATSKPATQSGPEIRLNLYSFYAFDDKIDSYWSSTEFFHGTMKGGYQWGGGLEVMMDKETGVELSYLRLDSEAPMVYWNNGEQRATFDFASNYIMVGANRYFGLNPKVQPYFGGQIGLTVISGEHQENKKSDNTTKFAWGIKAGANIWASDRVGLKIQAGLLSAVQAAGGGFYLGTGGAGGGLSLYSSIYQWNIGGGLTFRLGQ